MLHIQPKPNAPCEIFPFFLELPYRSLTFLVELRYAVLFNIFFRLQSQFLLNLQFDGESMGIPAGFSLHQKTAHSLVAAYHILEHTR